MRTIPTWASVSGGKFQALSVFFVKNPIMGRVLMFIAGFFVSLEITGMAARRVSRYTMPLSAAVAVNQKNQLEIENHAKPLLR